LQASGEEVADEVAAVAHAAWVDELGAVIIAFVSLGLRVLLLDLVKALDHVISKVVVIPEDDERGNERRNHALHTADVGQVVEESVAFAADHSHVQLHLDGDVHLHVIVFLVGLEGLDHEFEDARVLQLREIIKIDPLVL